MGCKDICRAEHSNSRWSWRLLCCCACRGTPVTHGSFWIRSIGRFT